jgi:hypothetical protein
MVKELNQMIEKGVWHPIHPDEAASVGRIIPSKMFMKKKTDEHK